MKEKIQPLETTSILIVDDIEENLLALEGCLENPDLKIVKATSGNEALGLMLEEDFALVLLDVQMPEMDGFETAALMRLSEKTKHIPIIFVTAISKEQKHIFKGYDAGAVDYLLKPLDTDILRAKVRIFLQLYQQKRLIENSSEDLKRTSKALEEANAQLKKEITFRKLVEEELKETVTKLRKTLNGTIQTISQMVESKDPYTAGHQRKVSDLARAIAQEMGLSEVEVDNIRIAGLLHDIGKLSVPSEILIKPTKLSDIEMSLIQAHAQSGYEILKDGSFPYNVAEIVLQHHERMNGSGYPQGLSNGDILPEAKILVVADVVEAISFHRPYRPAHGIEVALDEITRNQGELYDPEAVEACLRLFREKRFEFKKDRHLRAGRGKR